MVNHTRRPASADHLPQPVEVRDGVQGQRQETVGSWREAVIVGAFLVFACFTLGLASLAGK